MEKNEINITPQEKKILELLSLGYSSSGIADYLFISINTVETHRKNLHNKFGVTRTHQLLKEANITPDSRHIHKYTIINGSGKDTGYPSWVCLCGKLIKAS